MTKPQEKTLAIIRVRGQMPTAELTTYQGRSLEALTREGHVFFTACGECDGCRYRDRLGEPRWYSCNKAVVHAVCPLRKNETPKNAQEPNP